MLKQIHNHHNDNELSTYCAWSRAPLRLFTERLWGKAAEEIGLGMSVSVAFGDERLGRLRNAFLSVLTTGSLHAFSQRIWARLNALVKKTAACLEQAAVQIVQD